MALPDSIKQFFELFFEMPDRPASGKDDDELQECDPQPRYNINGLLLVGGVDALGNPPGVADDLHSSGRWD